MPMSDVMIASRPFGVAKNIKVSAQPATANGASTLVLRRLGFATFGSRPDATEPRVGQRLAVEEHHADDQDERQQRADTGEGLAPGLREPAPARAEEGDERLCHGEAERGGDGEAERGETADERDARARG